MALARHPSRELRRRQPGIMPRHAAAWNRGTTGNMAEEHSPHLGRRLPVRFLGRTADSRIDAADRRLPSHMGHLSVPRHDAAGHPRRCALRRPYIPA